MPNRSRSSSTLTVAKTLWELKVVLVLLGWHSGNSRAAAYSPTRKLNATNTRLCQASVGGAIGWQTDDGTTFVVARNKKRADEW